MSSSKKILDDGTLALKKPPKLLDPLDMIVVGGGPAGSAAAFRAFELGITPLVIDYDDILTRIRDYSKNKLILPHFSGGRNLKFPLGGYLISRLPFEPIDKDDLHESWKAIYYEYNIPAKLGVELTGLKRRDDGIWEVFTKNLKTKSREIFRARHVVLAIGAGFPRQLDIAENTKDICYKLADAENYTGDISCIIGGGTSAAEAVIAISNAKIKADDETPVYWSYRGTQMPKVSTELSEDFFHAYVVNGNIRFYPNSEPGTIVTAEDHRKYLAIRVDRRFIKGRPNECTYLEFPIEKVVACIGQDKPEKLLHTLGINMIEWGEDKLRYLATTPWLETQLPNVYLIGDILSPAHLVTENFNAKPPVFEEIFHLGNIKAAIKDGVLVAGVIAQKLDGKKEISVTINYPEESKKSKSETVDSRIVSPPVDPVKPADIAALVLSLIHI